MTDEENGMLACWDPVTGSAGFLDNDEWLKEPQSGN